MQHRALRKQCQLIISITTWTRQIMLSLYKEGAASTMLLTVQDPCHEQPSKRHLLVLLLGLNSIFFMIEGIELPHQHD